MYKLKEITNIESLYNWLTLSKFFIFIYIVKYHVRTVYYYSNVGLYDLFGLYFFYYGV